MFYGIVIQTKLKARFLGTIFYSYHSIQTEETLTFSSVEIAKQCKNRGKENERRTKTQGGGDTSKSAGGSISIVVARGSDLEVGGGSRAVGVVVGSNLDDTVGAAREDGEQSDDILVRNRDAASKLDEGARRGSHAAVGSVPHHEISTSSAGGNASGAKVLGRGGEPNARRGLGAARVLGEGGSLAVCGGAVAGGAVAPLDIRGRSALKVLVEDPSREVRVIHAHWGQSTVCVCKNMAAGGIRVQPDLALLGIGLQLLAMGARSLHAEHLLVGS